MRGWRSYGDSQQGILDSLKEQIELAKHKEEILIGNNGRYYYLKTPYTTLDMDIARMANMSLNDYITTMINSFHGFMNKGIKFNNKRDVEQAKDWIESVIVMNKLVGDNNGREF